MSLPTIILKEIKYKDTYLQFKEPITMTPICNKDNPNLYIVDNPNLNLYLTSYSLDDITHKIQEHIIFLWEEYVNQPMDKLNSYSRSLQHYLLSVLVEL